ncbi:hypothetical protein [Paenibacillus polymyxa]|uniref:Uncharacterized protein n=1 Tax=Paenibacillus polymyxa (strain SC2) TaxID=886882 RepID=E3EIJ2_PAEPS|nr:hypothetical protein [Paenibacillus polymyxa]ADO55630.1 hypothetical protein PPSC2_07850 [Paenibacillus polymyxa SC2]WPQ58387.1 hypothetical protein SKN87_08025 [Paenibacillus polymyxa]CCC84427.1 hypothetical protein PPM_1490 [Paenibacillus polymyxa M1]
MTITLNNKGIVNLTTTQTPYHSDLTIEKLCWFLEVSPKAEILVTKMKFMLRTVERMNEFLQRKLPTMTGLSLLTVMRKEDIDAHGYTFKADFVYDYYRNKKGALEKLFQEEMPTWKVNRLKKDDPERTYDGYVERGKYSSSLEVALSI